MRNGRPASINLIANTDAILTGDAFADATSQLNISLASGATWTGAAQNVASVTLVDSIWNMTGNSVVDNLINDPSQINFLPPLGDPTLLSSYKTLIVNDYTGDGIIALNTYGGAEGSPSDRLVIDGGTATGSTTILPLNTGGPGDLTIGDGILVVNAINGGTTAPGAFRGFMAAGPYDYLLFRGGASGADDWFLRSSLQPVLPIPPNPAEPPAPSGPPAPRYRQEVSLYEAMPVMAAIYGRRIIDTLHERMGGDAQRLQPGVGNRPDGAWGRLIGHRGHVDGDPVGIHGTGPEFDYDFGALQAGVDLHRQEHSNGHRDNAGVYLAIGRGDADVEHNILGFTFPGGTDKFDAVSVGGYWTRFGKNDWYLDGVVQGTWYDIDMSGRRGLRGETDGFGFAASLEGGYPFNLGGNWQLEPQAQLIYQAIDISGFNDGAADVRYSDTNSLAGRIGARLSNTWSLGAPTPAGSTNELTIWGRADIWHEFLGDPITEFSSASGFIPFTADTEETWGNAGIGADYQINSMASWFGNVNYESTFDGDATAWEGKVGLKVQW